MPKERFKVGYKVLPINPERWPQRNNIGTIVTESTPSMPLIIVEWKENGTSRQWGYLPSEIKRVFLKNEQMRFPFMYD